MSTTETQTDESNLAIVPLPENIHSVQPGSGFCYRVELAWGRLRRCWLKAVRSGYVKRMDELATGSAEGAPHEVLDPRDLKFCRNLCTKRWRDEDDPFRWREKIPLARWGLAETQIMGWPLFVLTILPAILFPWFWFVGVVPLVFLGWVFYFFRDPTRRVPEGANLIIAPADGKVVDITRLEHDETIGGPAVRIGIFLSIFNVHINRAPCAAHVLELQYHPGPFLNALKPESARVNENMWILLQQTQAPHRKIVVRQIAGAIARRIVCQLRPGDAVEAGEKFGMIKLGSRTEIFLPDEEGLKIHTEIGQKVQAGMTLFAEFKATE